MTAIRARRTKTTWIAFGLTLAVVVAAAVLSVAGVRTLADSTAGRRAQGQPAPAQTQRLPYTSTALVGTADDAGRLTSLVVLALEPNGVGGTIVSVAASADGASGFTDRLAPLDAVLEVDGAEAFAIQSEALTGLSYDVIEIIDRRRFAELIEPLGDLTVDLPTSLRDTSSGEEWEAGSDVLSSAEAGRIVTATDPNVEDWYFEADRDAIWRAVADGVGAGIGSADPVESDLELVAPATLDEFIDRLFAAPVEYRSLGFESVDADRVDEQLPPEYATAFGEDAAVSVVVHDRAEVLMVVGTIAPGRVGAPLAAPSFRVVAAYEQEELDARGLTAAEVLKQAINRLLYVQTNVVSVADLTGSGAPEVTLVEVADPSVIDAVESGYSVLFGELDVVEAEVPIEAIDIEVTLGLSFLDEIEATPDTDEITADVNEIIGSVEVSGGDASTDDDSGSDESSERDRADGNDDQSSDSESSDSENDD